MNRRREFLINSSLVLGTLAITPSLAFTTKKKSYWNPIMDDA